MDSSDLTWLPREAGETWIGQEDRRRRNHWIDPALASSRGARPSSSGRVIVGSSHIPRYYPTKLTAQPAGMDRASLRTVSSGGVQPRAGRTVGADTWKNGSKIGTRQGKTTRGRRLRRSGSRSRLHSGRHAAQRRIRRSRPATTLRQQSCRARRETAAEWHFQWSITTLGLRHAMAPNLLDITINANVRRPQWRRPRRRLDTRSIATVSRSADDGTPGSQSQVRVRKTQNAARFDKPRSTRSKDARKELSD